MPLRDEIQRRHLEQSLFSLRPRHDVGWQPWHDRYPVHVPPGLDYPPLRAEELLRLAAERFPDRMAVQFFRTHWSYGELLDRVHCAAAALCQLGLRPGDRVLLSLPNCPEFVAAWFALHWIGAEIVPVNVLSSTTELQRLARMAAAQTAIALDVRLAPVLDLARRHPLTRVIVVSLAEHLPWHLRLAYQLRARRRWMTRAIRGVTVLPFTSLCQGGGARLVQPLLCDASLPAVLQPTGGTTGTPKVAVLTHANLQSNVAQLHAWSGLQPGRQVVLAVLPFVHVFGSTVALLSPIAGGATLLLQARFDPRRVWRVMERWQPNVVPMVPFMVASLCREMRRRGRNLRGLQTCFCGASPLSAEFCDEFEHRTGATIVEGYGLSEASPVTHANPPDNTSRPGTIGLPLPDTLARIVDVETGRIELPPGTVGELVVRGPQVMAGYLDDAEETAQTLRDGWLHTGDLARRDRGGFFTIVDRAKDMILSAGLNVFPSEVEEVLSAHPDVAECAVVGVPDPLYGERVHAWVVPARGKRIHPKRLIAFCRRSLAAYKVPHTFAACVELPKNYLGKVRRNALRRRAA